MHGVSRGSHRGLRPCKSTTIRICFQSWTHACSPWDLPPNKVGYPGMKVLPWYGSLISLTGPPHKGEKRCYRVTYILGNGLPKRNCHGEEVVHIINQQAL